MNAYKGEKYIDILLNTLILRLYITALTRTQELYVSVTPDSAAVPEALPHAFALCT